VTVRDKTGTSGRGTPRVPPATSATGDHKVAVTGADPTPDYLAAKLTGDANITLTVIPGEQLKIGVTGTFPGKYPVPDNVFAINDDLDPTKFLNVQLAGQATGTTQTIVTTATVSRPFRLPDISGTAVVSEDVTGFTYIGGQKTQDNGSNARVQLQSNIANGSQYRSSQYGANVGVPGISTFKSRGASFPTLAACLPGDVIFRATAASVTQTGTIPLGGMISIQIPTDFPQTGQSWNATEFEIQLVPYTSATNGRRVSFKVTAGGEAQTLAGIRVGGPLVVSLGPNPPGQLNKGALISSGNGDPNGSVTGSVSDLWCRLDGGPGTTLYTKEAGAATNTGWSPITLPSYFNQLAASTVLPFGAPVVLHSLILTPRANHFFLINYTVTAFNQIVAFGTATATFELWIDGVMVSQANESITNNVEYGSTGITFRTGPLTAAPHTIEIRGSSNDVTGMVSVPIPGNSNLLVQEVAA
jgi:hypothetical protein